MGELALHREESHTNQPNSLYLHLTRSKWLLNLTSLRLFPSFSQYSVPIRIGNGTTFAVIMGCSHCADMAQTESNIEANPMLTSTLSLQIQEYPVLVYSSSRSPDCAQLKALLRDYGVKFEYFEVDRMSET